MRFKFLLVAVFAGALAIAQPAPERLEELKQSVAQNRQALQRYTWTETTQISIKGEVRKTTQKQCSYGPDGKVQKILMEPPVPEQSKRKGGPLKRRIVENKIEETEEYMERVAALVHQYAPPDPDKLQAAASAGNLAIQPKGSTTILTFKNYLKQGDTLAIGFDTAAQKMRSFNAQSFLDNPKDDAVSLVVNFASLLDGTSYPQQSTLNVKAKELKVVVTNSNYQK